MTASESRSSLQQAIFNRRTLICIFTGFSSGLPLYILAQLVPAWMRTEGIGLKEIGLFTLINLPYTWKFLWAPLMDRFSLPFLGLRRGWMLLTQIMLLLSIAALPWLDLNNNLLIITWLAAAVAFFSASQDVVLDAYRREILPDTELGFGNSIHINAYRIAGLIPGSLSLILADHFDWQTVFAVTAAFMLLGIALTLCIDEPEHRYTPHTLRSAVTEPFQEFFNRNGVRQATLILAFIFLYKLGDNMATALSTPFYIDLGFSLSEIGIIAKNAALWPMVFGSIAGGIIMIRLGINRSLWVFGVVQMLSILGFALLAHVGANLWLLGLVIGFEYLGVGLGTAAMVAFIARTTDHRYTATQFALFTAVAALPRSLANAATGYIVEATGWETFFYLCTLLAVPGMLLLVVMAPWQEAPQAEEARA
ncbi:AmpG family muropeptide MFS transporter [Pseudomaricurvus sp. HS19]|uniref:AmpG family muropeptide MFS transporter n=1 Tax=Pseudomaricurvus sp. HS19 TaxID=2692626 RepID=UPI001367CEA3|nr:AmpG family muropeptide MFS transporter [Pseudomaricurvus sp. HS19]MYM64723.1 MFS transporter [Pseudomaricurvus sp. HS19]